MDEKTKRLVGRSLKKRKESKSESSRKEGERGNGGKGALKCTSSRGRKSIAVKMIEKRWRPWLQDGCFG